MTKLTKERLERVINLDDIYDPDLTKAMACQILTGMEQEPVAEISQAQEYDLEGNLRYQRDIDYYQDDIDKLPVGTKLYAAPQLPQTEVLSVPDGVLKSLLPDAEKPDFWFEHNGKIFFEGVRFNNAVFEACRAAMLQGAEQQNRQQNIPENIPATQFKPVADLYGLTSPTGSETSFTFDAVEARDFIDGGWSCQEYVELGRFQEAMLQNGNSPAQSDCCPEQNYIAPAQDGNSPVIPDGWVLVPEEPTHEMLEAGDEQFGTYDVYRRMIAASPQQEA
ncbi:hypothetical protein [Enterobacter hormaechei]|uniref:hypothetical protein n=1 Tax=Enterobacter hormaechei TaxID=158836 RepID=UPI00079579D7|nr:hypothetical protein [Enterobacter hormaechei]CZZ53611.1 Uncharacterised protein [Enterobacter hormaechei]